MDADLDTLATALYVRTDDLELNASTQYSTSGLLGVPAARQGAALGGGRAGRAVSAADLSRAGATDALAQRIGSRACAT